MDRRQTLEEFRALIGPVQASIPLRADDPNVPIGKCKFCGDLISNTSAARAEHLERCKRLDHHYFRMERLALKERKLKSRTQHERLVARRREKKEHKKQVRHVKLKGMVNAWLKRRKV